MVMVPSLLSCAEYPLMLRWGCGLQLMSPMVGVLLVVVQNQMAFVSALVMTWCGLVVVMDGSDFIEEFVFFVLALVAFLVGFILVPAAHAWVVVAGAACVVWGVFGFLVVWAAHLNTSCL